ncbi:MAG: Lrp/AsnC family transcriptional regulator [Deltaproteobacteria bacterium]|jgi:Lrp/AsnC family leucine-responsive transcriptional regulator
MRISIERLLDRIGKNILDLLQKNARITFTDLGRKVGLSTPAATERVRKLEEAGVITGYHAAVDPVKVGLAVTAFIHVTTPPQNYARIKTAISSLKAVQECHHISGEESFLLKVVVPSATDLESLVGELSPYGRTKTAIVLSTQSKRTGIPLH